MKTLRTWFCRVWSPWVREGSHISPLSPIIHIDLRLFGVTLFSLTAHWKGLPANTTYVALEIPGISLAVGTEESGFCNEAAPKPVKKPRRKAK